MESIKRLSALATLALLTACGSGGSDGPGTGTLSVGLTDATVEDLDELRLYVTGITIKPQGGPPETYGINPDIVDCSTLAVSTDDCNPVNLLALQDGIILTILPPTQIGAGAYQWLRLEIDNDQSYAIDTMGGTYTGDSGMLDVRVPSERGLQLSGGFVILQGQTTDITMDWEARKGVVNPIGQDLYIVKPTIRIVDMAEWGSLVGDVADGIMMTDACTEGAAVYVYEGDLPTEMTDPDDIDNNDPEPLVTAGVKQRDNGSYGYEVHFLAPGTYTAALTCDAELDDPPADDMDDAADNSDVVSFSGTEATTIVDGQDSRIDFN
jgi:hypothetical protein